MIWRLVAILAGIFSLYAAGYVSKEGADGKATWSEISAILVIVFFIEFIASIAVAVTI